MCVGGGGSDGAGNGFARQHFSLHGAVCQGEGERKVI